MVLLLGPVLSLLQLVVTLFLCQLEIHLLGCNQHGCALSLMELLGLFQHLVKVNSLLVEASLVELLLSLNRVLLVDLLLNPFFLLLLLQLLSLLLHYNKRVTTTVDKTYY